MSKHHLAALLMVCAVPSNAAPNAAVGPPLDTAVERRALRNLTICVAELRPRWARQLISYPYLSDAQANAAALIVSGDDHCMGGQREVAVTFRTSGVVGAIAEHFVRADLPKLDQAKVSSALASAPPLNVSEDFALCLASRNPAASVELATSELGSEAESRAATVIGASVPTCTRQGERLDVDTQALRALISTALYRAIAANRGSNG